MLENRGNSKLNQRCIIYIYYETFIKPGSMSTNAGHCRDTLGLDFRGGNQVASCQLQWARPKKGTHENCHLPMLVKHKEYVKIEKITKGHP